MRLEIVLSNATTENRDIEYTLTYQRTKVDESIFLYLRATLFFKNSLQFRYVSDIM